MPFAMLIFAILSFRYFVFLGFAFRCHESLQKHASAIVVSGIFFCNEPLANLLFAEQTPYFGESSKNV